VDAQDAQPTPVPEASPFDVDRIRQATVFIIQAQSFEDTLNITCVGSGTVVSRDGLILTNAHNVVESESCPGDVVIIALSVDVNAPPVPRYRAEIVQHNLGLDIALLRINREYDGRLLSVGSLALPFVTVVDSDDVELDDTITLVGYPGIGNDVIREQVGTIVAFVAEPSAGTQAWMKSSINIPSTMSGGGAYNRNGELVGIPTTAPVNPDLPGANCVTLQDTNQDNAIDSNDVCIPTGGLISTIRPSNFARPLIRAAQLGISVDSPAALTPSVSSTTSVTPQFSRLFFSSSVNEAGLPTQVIRSLPAGSTSLYLFFDYANMSSETVYEVRVTTDGVPNPTFSLSPVRWSGGAHGLWYVGTSGQPIPNGVYEFTIVADGIPTETARLNIGEGIDTSPQFSDIIFGISDDESNVSGNGYILPVGNTASAVFIYREMQPDLPWAQLWYFEGVEIARTELPWTDGVSGAKTITIQDASGLLPGQYRLELYIDGRLGATADFTLAGSPQGALPQVFVEPRFTNAASPAEATIAQPSSTFLTGESEIYFVFDWQNLATATPWTVRWSVDDLVFFETTTPWQESVSGENYLLRLSNPSGLPDGTYAVELSLGALRLSRTQARVGIGQLPIDPFAQTDGVRLRGTILDVQTSQGIPGVSFVLINELFSVADFLASYDASMVTALATTDRAGRFEIDRPLSFDIPYSVLIIAEGYLPIQADGFVLEPGDVPIDLIIYLSRG
jgi:hypothetical protein